MDVIGNILKGTTKLGYKRQVRRSQRLKDQNYTLKKLLTKARFTEFGTAYHFNEMLRSDTTAALFKAVVPITSYEQFHEQWLHQSLDGKKNVTWPGKISFYALSSGTTNSASKRIPVSDSMIRQFQRTTIKQILGIHDLNLPGAFYESNVLIIGGSTALKKVKGYYEGDLSGILAKNKSFVLTPFSKPPSRISKITDWNEKMEQIVDHAPHWDIGVIAGVPSWVALLLERIIERYQLDSIHDIWPNLSIYKHGGIFLDPYKSRLEKTFGKHVCYRNTYLASEGYFAYQKRSNAPGMQLLLNDGIYYEFVEQAYFDQMNTGHFDGVRTINIDEVEAGVPYAMIISTCAGLWRYSIGDVIEFTDSITKNIKIVGRISFGMSYLGEHVSDGNMIDAIRTSAERFKIEVEEFTAHINPSQDGHIWYIGTSDEVPAAAFAKSIDERLKVLNDDYNAVRKYTLKAPEVVLLPPKAFYQYLETYHKVGGQTKFPRVLKTSQIDNWLSVVRNY